MPFRIVYSDITELKVDAIVNSTNQWYSGGGTGVDSLIHIKCGKALYDVTQKLPPLRLGEAKATPGFVLPCKYIIHTSGPSWRESHFLETSLLGSCYRNSIQLAYNLGCRSIAFPLISSHSKEFPKETALATAIDAIKEALHEYPDMEIILAIFGRWTESIPEGFFDSLSDFVNDMYAPEPEAGDVPAAYGCVMEEVDYVREKALKARASEMKEGALFERDVMFTPQFDPGLITKLIDSPTQENLDRIPVDENFAQMLNRLMAERGTKTSDILDQLGISNAALSKIRHGINNPAKMTVFALAIFFRLSLDETVDMLMKAGYAINPSSIQDVVVAGLIRGGIYDRYVIDDLLYDLDLQPLPGAVTG